MCLNHPQIISPTPGPWKNCLPENWSPQKVGDCLQLAQEMLGYLCACSNLRIKLLNDALTLANIQVYVSYKQGHSPT